MLCFLRFDDGLHVAVVRDQHGLDLVQVDLDLRALLVDHQGIHLELLFSRLVVLHLPLQITLDLIEVPVLAFQQLVSLLEADLLREVD